MINLDKLAAQSLVSVNTGLDDGVELIFSKEKYAALIVQECLDILEDEDTHDIYGQPIRLATIRIKKLFGVPQ